VSKVEELAAVARELPPEAVDELLRLARSWQTAKNAPPPFVPEPLGGLWEGFEITDAEIRDTRREMWRGTVGA
jgi:hypothetical protein